MIKATPHDFDVTWSPHLVFNGAMPATIAPSKGTTVDVWITWLDDSELAQMHATEGVGTPYSYGYLSSARLEAPGARVTRPWLYVDCSGALRVGGRTLAVRDVHARDRRFTAVDSSEALQKVARTMGWRKSVFDLLVDNVQSPERRADRSQTLAHLGDVRSARDYAVVNACTNG